MQLELLNMSMVIVAEGHNPTILHPASLAAKGITPKDWQLAEPPACTPPFAIVKYANGITFAEALAALRRPRL